MSVSEDAPLLSVRDLVVEFASRGKQLRAIRNIELDIYAGETLAIVGESGSGKSVLTKTFNGMLEANGCIVSGSLSYRGEALPTDTKSKDWEKIRGKEIATVFQDPMTSLNPVRTIGAQITEVITKHQGMNPRDAKKLAIELMERTGITNAKKRFDQYPFEFSGGMRQRIVITIALACRPRLLICDEPTTALDVTIQAQILDLIKSLQQEYGFTTVYITHDLGVVAAVADRVAVMYSGQIVEYGTVEDIFYDPRHPYTWSLLSSLPQLGVPGEMLYSIPGTPPSLFGEITGDAFAPRNPFAMQIDFEDAPEATWVTEDHYARTWLLDPRAPKVEPPDAVRNLRSRLTELSNASKAAEVNFGLEQAEE
ncbi:MAG: ABC transporter ATP-binding protein [Microbacterium sp.]